MSVNTINLLSLRDNLSEAMGDHLAFSTTTNIAASATVVSTTLRQYDDGANGHFDTWWVEITEGSNAAVVRKTGLPAATTYATATGTLYVAGAALAAESAAVACRLHRYNPTYKTNAIKEAAKEVYPALHLPLEDQTLITGNILPDASLESWASSTSINTPWRTNNAALVRTAVTGQVRNGLYSAKVTASAASGDIRISSDDYPRLLDLQNQTVDIYGWVYPEVTNDAQIIIETTDKAGSTQSLASTAAASASVFTEIKLESQRLNDNLDNITLRLVTKTNTKYVIWDDLMLQGRYIFDYLLPDKFRDGHVSKVFMQTEGHSDEACYDLNPFSTISPGIEKDFSIIDEGDQRYLHFDERLTTQRRLRLIGYKPLEAMSADSDTVTLNTEKIPLLLAKAAMIFYERYQQPVSAEDITRYNFAHGTAKRKFTELMYTQGMAKPSEKIKR